MRKQPSIEPPNVSILANQQPTMTIREERRYKLITPLFGGGAEPGACDEVTTIRATEIRGLLRFWWRACRGGQFGDDLKTMKAVEDAIWGSPATSKDTMQEQKSTGSRYYETIQIEVEVVEPEKVKAIPYPFNTYNQSQRSPGTNRPKPLFPLYAAFPLQPDRDEKKKRERNRFEKAQGEQRSEEAKSVYTDITFILTITYSQEQKKIEELPDQSISTATELEAALWAWETFGSIGARTRRGFGAIKLESINGEPYTDLPSAEPRQARQWIQKHLENFIQREHYLDLPHLQKSSTFRIIQGSGEAITVWNRVVGKLQQFRQLHARGGTGRNMGRTQWPEPEAIREITGSTNRKEPNPIHKYPRAAFGLPIVFHFKDGNDPKDVTLQGAQEGNDRLASPLILRPLACQNNQFVGLALLLEGSHIPHEGLVLKGEQIKKPHKVSADLAKHEAQRIPILNGEQDVLKAFLKFFGGQ
jgi:CRISPR-associated protein Cmr1